MEYILLFILALGSCAGVTYLISALNCTFAVKQQEQQEQKAQETKPPPKKPVQPVNDASNNNKRHSRNLIQEQQDAHKQLANMAHQEQASANFSNQGLVLLPFQLRRLQNLIKLDLSGNHLSSLPVQFCSQLQLLKVLNLSGNLFFELPLVSLPSIEELYLSKNKFEYVPLCVQSMTKLRHLELQNNSLLVLPPELSKLSDLQVLDISNNSLLRLPEELVALNKLKVLKLQNNKFLNQISKVLGELIEKNPELENSLLDALEDGTNIKGIIARRKSSVSPTSVVPTPSTPEKQFGSSTARAYALIELRESEKKYFKYLNILHEQYYLPIVKQKYSALDLQSICEIFGKDPSKLFPPHITSIVTFNQAFLKEMESTIPATSSNAEIAQICVGKMFLEWAPHLKMYSAYIADYEKAQADLSKILKENPNVKEVFDKGRQMSDGLDVNALLIMPVQRVPRYVLLLGAVMKVTPPDHPDYLHLASAVTKIEEIATFINKKIEEAVNRMRVIDIQFSLNVEGLVQPHRSFVREGQLKLRKNDEIEELEYQVYLFNDLLLLRQTSLLNTLNEYFGQVQAEKIEIPNNTAQVVINDTSSLSFVIQIGTATKLSFVAVTEKQRELWLKAFNKIKNQA